VTRALAADMTVLGGAITLACLAVAVRARAAGAPWQSSLFVTLALAQLGIALSTRSSEPVWRQRWSGNPLLLLAVALSAALTVAGLYLAPLAALLHTDPLRASDLLVAAIAAALPAVAFEVLKAFRRRRVSPTAPWKGSSPPPGEDKDEGP
jgi:P-type Ca2+ transporter type 2C